MRRFRLLGGLIMLVAAAPALLGSTAESRGKNRLPAEESENGWKQIFDGKTLKG